MFIKNNPYHFTLNGISKLEELYKAKYVGPWCTKRLDGQSWNETPVDVFYVENPDRSKGHSNYFGMFVRDSKTFITNAESAFSEPIMGLLCSDGEVIVSRFRHDYIMKENLSVDGGRDYFRRSALGEGGRYINVVMQDGEFSFTEAHETI